MAEQKNRRFRQANKEALLTLGLYAFYFLWWYGFAYGLGSGDPKEYSYILGFPAWFFLSCIAGCPVLTLVLWLVLRKGFKDMPLDAKRLDMPQDAERLDIFQDAEHKDMPGEKHE
ncbi:MAG: YhdT family protein [Deltaproteobacteria bacterium]|jgi:uncharacterized membrane protein YhdT|nr:YhdT family protein [Deltaproteobacteria bacterium]